MLMWSGQGDEGFFNDLWAFNLDQGTWNELSATGTIPNPRYGTVSALDPESGSMAIFAGFTDITYELAAPAPVRLSIVDLLGREVRRLAAGPRLAGRHTAIWDGRDQQGRRAGSGVYLYRLETPAGVQTKKLVLVR